MPLSTQKIIKRYVKKNLGSPADLDVDKLKIEYEKAKEENTKLKKLLDDLKKEVKSSVS